MNSKVSYGSLAPVMIGGLGVIIRVLIAKASRGEPPVTVKKLPELIEFCDSGIWGDEALDEKTDPRVLRVSDFAGDFCLKYESAPARTVLEEKMQKYQLRTGDILVVKSSGSANQVVSGRVAVFDATTKRAYAASNFLLRLRPKSDINPHYLAFVLGSPPIREAIADSVKTMTYPNLSFRIYSEMKVPVIPPEDQHTVAAFFSALLKNEQLPKLPHYLAEQQRIVARIEELATKINEACALRQETQQEVEALLGSVVSRLYRSSTWKMKAVSELLGENSLRNGKSVKPNGDIGEVRCLTLSSMRNGHIDVRDNKTVPLNLDEAQPFLIRNGDVFIVRGNGSKRLCGMAGLVAEEMDAVIFPDLFIHVPLARQYILPEFFVAAWNSAATREIIEEKAKTKSGIWKVNQGHISSTEIPVPPLSEQRRVIAELGALQVQVNALKRLQNETAAELDALLPSILDKAFNGEL